MALESDFAWRLYAVRGGPFTLSMRYNTAVQTTGETQGLMTEFISSGQFTNNTTIGKQSFHTSVGVATLTGPYLLQDNYFDITQSFGFCYALGAPSAFVTFTHTSTW